MERRLSGDAPFQESDARDDGESGRAGDDPTTVARAGNVHARGAAPVRGPRRTSGSAGHRHHSSETMVVGDGSGSQASRATDPSQDRTGASHREGDVRTDDRYRERVDLPILKATRSGTFRGVSPLHTGRQDHVEPPNEHLEGACLFQPSLTVAFSGTSRPSWIARCRARACRASRDDAGARR